MIAFELDPFHELAAKIKRVLLDLVRIGEAEESPTAGSGYLTGSLAALLESAFMSGSSDEVERGIRLQNLIREEFSRVDADYGVQQFDESGGLVYGPTVSFTRTGPEFRYSLVGCGDRYDDFEAALIRVFDRFGRLET